MYGVKKPMPQIIVNRNKRILSNGTLLIYYFATNHTKHVNICEMFA